MPYHEDTKAPSVTEMRFFFVTLGVFVIGHLESIQ